MTDSHQDERPVAAWTDNRSETLQVVEGIAKEVLKQPALNVVTHFVDLGGDSLAAMTLTCRLSQAFGLNLSPLLPFEAEHLEDMAGRIHALRAPLERPSAALTSGEDLERGLP